jgi:hypothetical protein
MYYAYLKKFINALKIKTGKIFKSNHGGLSCLFLVLIASQEADLYELYPQTSLFVVLGKS